MKVYFAIAILLPFLALMHSKDLAFYPCNDKSNYNNLGCTINRVSVEGCSSGTNKECRLKRGREASVVIDFIPDFDSETADMTIYTTTPFEKAWPGMDTNACNHMKCPVENGVSNTYNLGINISPQYPTGLFTARFLLTKDTEPKCCFLAKIKIER